MEQEEFGARLRRLREDRNISVRELARRSGRSHPMISQIETGQRWRGKLPPYDDLRAFAQVLNVTVDELVGEREPRAVPRRQLTDDELFDKIGAGYEEDTVFIEDVAASAGSGSAIPQDIDDTIPKRRKNRRFKYRRTMLVTGRCMEPELCPGDLVTIDRDRAPVVGKFVLAVRDEEEVLIKRLTEREGEWFLTANDGRPDIPIDGDIRILGPVVAYQRHLL